jgi:hypothetical protein
LEWSPIMGSTLVASSLGASIRLGWKYMAVANTLAYYDTATITAVKSFVVQASTLEAKY